MDILEAIRTRRSIGKVKEDPIPKETIEEILEAAVWAPNHRLTEPWRFFVMRGDGRLRLGEALAEIALEGVAADDPDIEAKEEAAKKKALRSPVVIGAAVCPGDAKGVVELEEYGAVFAAIQNMLLAAHAMGLGAVWRTGDPCFHPVMNERFGLGPKDKMLGFVYLGLPDMNPPAGKRSGAAGKTEWIG